MLTAGSLLLAVEIAVGEIDAMGEEVFVPYLLTGVLMAVLRYGTGEDPALGLDAALGNHPLARCYILQPHNLFFPLCFSLDMQIRSCG